MRNALRLAGLSVVLASVALAGCSGSSGSDLSDPSAAGGSKTSTSSSGTQPGGGGGTETEAPGTGAGSGAGAGTGTGESTDGPIRIKNVSFASAPASYPYRNAVQVTFAIEKKSESTRIDRVQEVSVTFGGQKRTYALGCTGTYLELSSKVVELTISDDGSTSSVDFACQVSARADTTMPWGNDVTVELRGLLDDATPWKASASGSR